MVQLVDAITLSQLVLQLARPLLGERSPFKVSIISLLLSSRTGVTDIYSGLLILEPLWGITPCSLSAKDGGHVFMDSLRRNVLGTVLHGKLKLTTLSKLVASEIFP